MPWLAECFDDPPEDLGFDRVDGASGAALLGVDVLLEPLIVHHLIGNVEEWLADPADVLTTGVLLDGPRWWTTPETDEERARPRVARGQSVFSPSGQSGSRLLVLEPGVRADDLGVRCARTTRSPYAAPTPYDSGAGSQAHARCDRERPGLRPVRQMSGQRVYRATDVCFEGPATDLSARRFFEARMQTSLLQGSSAFALLTQVDGEVAGVGLARFAIDEQWWLAKPTDELGGAVVLGNNQVSIALDWAGASDVVSEACQREMVDSTQAATDGRLLRGVEFIVDVEDVIKLNRASQGNPAAFACTHLDCAEPLEPTEVCAESCTTWRLPLAISFERVEPFDRAEMCAQSVLNPAER